MNALPLTSLNPMRGSRSDDSQAVPMAIEISSDLVFLLSLFQNQPVSLLLRQNDVGIEGSFLLLIF